MHLKILDIQSGVRSPLVLAKSSGEFKDFNLYLAPLPRDLIEKKRKHTSPDSHGKLRQRLRARKYKSPDRMDRFHFPTSPRGRIRLNMPNINKSSLKHSSYNTSDDGENWDHFYAKEIKFGKTKYQCISFSHKVIRAQWKPDYTFSNDRKFGLRPFIRAKGSFVVLTSDGVLRLFVLRNGKPMLSLSIDIDVYSSRHLRWIWIIDPLKRKSKHEFSDLLVWNTRSNHGGITGVYRIHGLESVNLHVWADFILPSNSIHLNLCGRTIAKATYNWTCAKYTSCLLVDNPIQLDDRTLGEWVHLHHDQDIANHYQERAFSRILPPISLLLLGKNARAKALITPHAILKSVNTANRSTFNQIKEIKYSSYIISDVLESRDPDSLCAICGITGYIKATLLEGYIDYRNILLVLYPCALHIFLLEPINPLQTLHRNSMSLTLFKNSVNLASIVLESTSIVILLSNSMILIYNLQKDLSLELLESFDFDFDFDPKLPLKLWKSASDSAILQIGSKLITIVLNGKKVKLIKHEHLFPDPVVSDWPLFISSLISLGQFTLLKHVLYSTNSLVDLLDILEHGQIKSNNAFKSNNFNSNAFNSNNFDDLYDDEDFNTYEAYNTQASNVQASNVQNPQLEGRKSENDLISQYFSNVIWEDSDFVDFDISKFISQGSSKHFRGSGFAFAQFKLLASLLINSTTNPLYENISTSSLSYWAALYGRDLDLVEYLDRIISGRDDVFTLLHRLEIGNWISTTPAINRLSDIAIRELVRAIKSDKSYNEELMDQLGLWCIMSNKVKLYSSIAKLKLNERLSNFLLNDFNEAQWQANAEKNAFASISKQRFYIAVGFFILANKWNDAISLVEQRIRDDSLLLLLNKMRPGGLATSYQSNIENPLLGDLTIQSLLNYAASFGPLTLFLVANRFKIDYFIPILHQIIFFDPINLIADLPFKEAESLWNRLPLTSRPRLTPSLLTLQLAFALWYPDPPRVIRAIKTLVLLPNFDDYNVNSTFNDAINDATNDAINEKATNEKKAINEKNPTQWALLYLIASLLLVSNDNITNSYISKRMISRASSILNSEKPDSESIREILWNFTFKSESPNSKFLGIYHFDHSIDSLFNLRILFHMLVQVFNLFQSLRRINEIESRTCLPLQRLSVAEEESSGYFQFFRDSYLSQMDEDIHKLTSQMDTDVEDIETLVSSKLSNMISSRDYYLLDLLQRLQWEIANFADEFSSFDFSNELDFSNDSKLESSSDSLLLVPSGGLIKLKNQAQLNELISFTSGPINGLLFRDWTYKTSESNTKLLIEPPITCTSSCLFTICSLLKKFKGRNISSFGSSSGVYCAGALGGGIVALVSRVSDADSNRPGIYKVDVSVSDCFSILQTLSDSDVYVSFSQNLTRLALIDLYGWVHVYKIPHTRGSFDIRSRDKKITLSGVHCFTFRCGEHGIGLVWIPRDDGEGPLLATISGVFMERGRGSINLDNQSEIRLGSRRFPSSQQLCLWQLHMGRDDPALGLSAGLDSGVTLTCITCTSGDNIRLCIGDDIGNVRMLNINGNCISVGKIIKCLDESIVSVISLETVNKLLVLGSCANAIIIDLDNDVCSKSWKIISLLDGKEMISIKAARLVSDALLVVLGSTGSDRLLVHHTHI